MDIENIFFIAPLHEFLANRHKTSWCNRELNFLKEPSSDANIHCI
jgi:hypothetical protein